MILGIAKEHYPDETRVALTPEVVPELVDIGLEPVVQEGAGQSSGFSNSSYEAAGATIVNTREEVYKKGDIVAQIHGFGSQREDHLEELDLYEQGQVLVGLQNPRGRPRRLEKLADRGLTVFAMELIPRISRAQNMDVLSSQATVSGYKSVLIAANEIPKMMPMMMTAAGTVTAARTLVIGAGVAGLQAIATAKRLGSEVRAHDVRSNVKEEVESLGAKFVPVPAGDEQDSGVYAEERGEEFYERQRRLLLDIVPESDLVITSAAVPGKKAPVLLTRKMVEGMDRGSVVVDLAAEQGGNCELTESNEEMEMANGVKIIGPTNLPSKLPVHASNMYSNNINNFLKYLISDGKINLDMEDNIIENTLVVKEGKILNDQLREALNSEDDNDEGDEK
mgnify:CR=1 FL=1